MLAFGRILQKKGEDISFDFLDMRIIFEFVSVYVTICLYRYQFLGCYVREDILVNSILAGINTTSILLRKFQPARVSQPRGHAGPGSSRVLH